MTVLGDPIIPTLRAWRSTRAQCATHGRERRQPGQSWEVGPRLTVIPRHPWHPNPSTRLGPGGGGGAFTPELPRHPCGLPGSSPSRHQQPDARRCPVPPPEPRRTPGALGPARTRSSANDPRVPSPSTATLVPAAAPKVTRTPRRRPREPLGARVASGEGAGD